MQYIRVPVGERDPFNPNALGEFCQGPGVGRLHHGGLFREKLFQSLSANRRHLQGEVKIGNSLDGKRREEKRRKERDKISRLGIRGEDENQKKTHSQHRENLDQWIEQIACLRRFDAHLDSYVGLFAERLQL